MNATPLFRHILVPVDFTEKNSAALEVALQMAMHYRARLSLLHVIERIEQEEEESIQAFYAELEAKSQTSMKLLASRFAERGWPIRQEILYGRRGPEIIQFAIRHGVDLVVLSSHKVPLDRPQGSLGTLSHQISMLSQCPVLLVK